MTATSLTPNRYIGKPCTKCGNKVRMKTKAACTVCLREKAKKWAKKVGYRNRPYVKVAKRLGAMALRKKVRGLLFKRYGEKCERCAESRKPFLTIDHRKGGGTKERRSQTFIKWANSLLKGPKRRDIRVLCWNCNCGRQMNGGVCPHKT